MFLKTRKKKQNKTKTDDQLCAYFSFVSNKPHQVIISPSSYYFHTKLLFPRQVIICKNDVAVT